MLPTEMTGEANLRETARVIEIGARTWAPRSRDAASDGLGEIGAPPTALLPQLVLDEERCHRWHEATMESVRARTPVRHALLTACDLAVLVDCMTWHRRLGGWTVTLFRPATGLRGIYATETAAVAYVFDRLTLPLAEIHLMYLDKKRLRGPEVAWRELFHESSVLRRSSRRADHIAASLEGLRHAMRTGTLEETYACASGCNLCIPKEELDDGRLSVLTLHKGGRLGRELYEAGVRDLREVDGTVHKLSAKQRIQIDTVRSGVPHVDSTRLAAFLKTIREPIFYLDFEAYAPAIPPFEGLSPYEHTPVIASLHRQQRIGATADREWIVSRPGVDERPKLFRWLCDRLGETGSIVVFSKPFESAMIRQLAAFAGEEAIGRTIVSRMVDLLSPFADFAVYHPDQLGRVSLKRVLPAFTDSDYGESPLRDGMHANLAYTRLADSALATDGGVSPPTGENDGGSWRYLEKLGAAAAEGTSDMIEQFGKNGAAVVVSTDDIATYCSVDTRAMVDLLSTLAGLLAAAS
ncbi:MAG: DUF2779 domain-containing protein [Spirochaetales bacterium]|nr:DUF2779 domain-containing protein [Spirochaetales bacterium]